MTVRAYVLIEADQTRVGELRDTLPDIDLEGSKVTDIGVGRWARPGSRISAERVRDLPRKHRQELRRRQMMRTKESERTSLLGILCLLTCPCIPSPPNSFRSSHSPSPLADARSNDIT